MGLKQEITFSFGRNWTQYIDNAFDESRVEERGFSLVNLTRAKGTANNQFLFKKVPCPSKTKRR